MSIVYNTIHAKTRKQGKNPRPARPLCIPVLAACNRTHVRAPAERATRLLYISCASTLASPLRTDAAPRHTLGIPSSGRQDSIMVEAVLGKWQVDLDSTTGLEEFGAAIGFSEQRIETYRKLSYTLELSGAGDTFTATVVFDAEGIPPQTYSFKLGETIDYNAIDGTKPKLKKGRLWDVKPPLNEFKEVRSYQQLIKDRNEKIV
ncbi:hypothetical protein C0Q70_18272 [Pomacea canaliculata]|uniref:Uncharacterized protein n=1 Tax=Pomacea canaliculata TaxID=400727 RepID=A0A2T7NMR4_POMCA|nr:hypothetical protein C0Q70_18272 [Pomacea canaliculata]